jgi:hypothetical protein
MKTNESCFAFFCFHLLAFISPPASGGAGRLDDKRFLQLHVEDWP